MIEDATEIHIRAERRLGELLAETEKNKGAKGSGSNQHKVRSRRGTAPPTLAERGIDKKLSARAQKLAQMKPAAGATAPGLLLLE